MPRDAPVVESCVAATVPVPIVVPFVVRVTVPVGLAAPLAGVGVMIEVTVKVPLLTVVALGVTVLAVGAWAIAKVMGPPVLAFRLLSPA